MLRVSFAIAFGSLMASTVPSAVSAGESGISYLQRHHYEMPYRPRRAGAIGSYRGVPDPFVDVTGSISRRHKHSKVHRGGR